MAEQKRPDLETIEEVTIAAERLSEEDITDTNRPSDDTTVEYVYPEGLDSRFPARIIFTSYQIEGVNILKQLFGGVNALAQAAGKVVASFSSDDKKKGDETDDKPPESNQAESQETGILNYLKNNIDVQYQSYEDVSGGKKVGKVTLPLPRDLRYSDVIQYETANLGIIGGALESGLRGQNPFKGVTMNGQFGAAASSIVGGIVAKTTGVAGAAAIGGVLGGVPGAILGAAAGGDAGEALEGAVRSASRIAAAPNQRTLFKSVELRAFSFAFKMIARNKREAATIKNIVKFFRQEMYPEVIPLSNSVPLAYKFPNVFQIEIRNAYFVNPGFKIQRCYLRDVQTSFNSTAAGMFEDGQFIEVDITLSFSEITALDKGKIKQGY